MITAMLIWLLPQDPSALVERLGAEAIELRQAAEAELARWGAAAAPALDAGRRHPDPEIAARAGRLLAALLPEHEEARSHLRAARRAEDVEKLSDALRRLDARALREAVEATPGPERCLPCARRRLGSLKVGLRVENARVEDVLEYLGVLGGVKVLVPEEIRFDYALTVAEPELTLAEAFERVLRPYGKTARLTAEGVVRVVEAPRD